MSIHPTAVVAPEARLDPTVDVGPYAVIDAGVELGAGCFVGPHVYLTGLTTAGPNNRFYAGCVIGEAPQDLRYKGEPTGLRIGAGNQFRENVTVHRSNKPEEATIVGSNCLLMAGSHVGHNCHLGDGVILANGAMLGGHATIGDRAFISGNCLVHQFVRVGTLAMMQGGSAISQDLAPFTIARGTNGACGLNVVGLRRAGFSPAERLELKQLYQALLPVEHNLGSALAAAREQFTSPAARLLMDFVASSKRGICRHSGLNRDQWTEPSGES